jgi:DNA-binding LacI/PurR family transcriptional regulator
MDIPSRSRIPDIARAAGVSTATVDRVLHGRVPVRPATAQRVLQAAADLRYLPDQELWRTLRPAPMELAFLLPAGTNRFLRMLGDGIAGAGDTIAPFHVHCRVHTIDSFDPAKVAGALRRHGRAAQGVAFMALEHPRVREAVDELAARGVHVLTLISDLTPSRRAAYVGMDNRAAGRTAASLIGRFLGPRSGSVALIAGSLAYRGHEEREMGFLGLMQERFAGLRVVHSKRPPVSASFTTPAAGSKRGPWAAASWRARATKALAPMALMNCSAPPWKGAKPQPKIEPMLPSATDLSTPSSRQRTASLACANIRRSISSFCSGCRGAPGTAAPAPATAACRARRRPVVVETLPGLLADAADLAQLAHHRHAGVLGVGLAFGRQVLLRLLGHMQAQRQAHLVLQRQRRHRHAGLQARDLDAARVHALLQHRDAFHHVGGERRGWCRSRGCR